MEDKVRLLCICSLCKDREGKGKSIIDNWIVLQQIENSFNEYKETLNNRDKDVIESLMKAYYYLKSFRVTKSVSERNLMSNKMEWWLIE